MPRAAKAVFETFVIMSVWPTFLFIVPSRSNLRGSEFFSYLLLLGFFVFLKVLCVYRIFLFIPDFETFVCLDDVPVYCLFPQRLPWCAWYLFLLFVVQRILCIFETFVCLADLPV